MLLTVPNVSEGADRAVIDELVAATRPLRLLDLHSDPDHGRSVLTLAGLQGEVAPALARLAATAARLIDVSAHAGRHPHVGALDVAPVVYPDDARRGAAVAEALTAGALIGADAGVPGVPLRRAGHRAGARRARRAARRRARAAGASGSRRASSSPTTARRDLHPTAGATLVTARPPLVAFNVDLATDDVALARRIAAGLRESGGGPPGVRAIGLALPARGRAQVSFNVHDHRAAPLRDLVAAVRAAAPIAEAELVGLAPAAAFDGLPGRRAAARLRPRPAPDRERVTLAVIPSSVLRPPSTSMSQADRSASAATAAPRPARSRRAAAPAARPARAAARLDASKKKPANRAEARQMAQQKRAARFETAADLARLPEPRGGSRPRCSAC